MKKKKKMSCSANNKEVVRLQNSCGYNNKAVQLQNAAPATEPKPEKPAVAEKNTLLPSNMRVGMYMSDADTQYPDENNQGIGKPPPTSGDFTISMIMNARSAERSRRENGGRMDVKNDERACRNVPIGNTNVMQKECATLSNRSVPNPLIDRLFAVRSRYME